MYTNDKEKGSSILVVWQNMFILAKYQLLYWVAIPLNQHQSQSII